MNKNYAFVDRKCNTCNGMGELGYGSKTRICPECQGTGTIGSYEEVPAIQYDGDKEFGKLLRMTRVRRMISVSELAALLKCKVSRISEIECGLKMPTDKERENLEAWVNG